MTSYKFEKSDKISHVLLSMSGTSKQLLEILRLNIDSKKKLYSPHSEHTSILESMRNAQMLFLSLIQIRP